MTAIHNELLERVRHSLADEGAEPTPARVAAAVRAEGRLLGHDDVLELVDTLRRDAFGAGPLDALLREPEVTDIVVNRPDAVYIDRGDGLERTAVSFSDERDVRRLAQRLAAAGGRRLDDASPFVDVRLHDGTRFHAVLSPIAHPGTVLSLRVPARRAFTLEMLQVCGTLTPVAAGLLRDLVDARLAFLVSGGTGSGKTTLLATLLSLIGGRERLVLVEDVAELRPEHDHVVGLEARPPNVEGAGTITVRDLVRQALRMRPDRLVVGEVRGADAPRSPVTRPARRKPDRVRNALTDFGRRERRGATPPLCGGGWVAAPPWPVAGVRTSARETVGGRLRPEAGTGARPATLRFRWRHDDSTGAGLR